MYHSKTALKLRIFKGLVDDETAISLEGNGIASNNSPLASNDRFMGQLYVDGQPVSRNTFEVAQAVDVNARIHIAADKIGQSGEILRVVSYQGKMYMKTPEGWVSWNGQISSLIASEAPRPLKAIEDIVIEKSLGLVGKFEIFFGYRVNSQPFYNKTALKLTLKENDELTTEAETEPESGTEIEQVLEQKLALEQKLSLELEQILELRRKQIQEQKLNQKLIPYQHSQERQLQASSQETTTALPQQPAMRMAIP